MVRVGACRNVYSWLDDLYLRFLRDNVFDFTRCFFMHSKAPSCGVTSAYGRIAGRVNACSYFSKGSSVVFRCSFSLGGKDYYCWRYLFSLDCLRFCVLSMDHPGGITTVPWFVCSVTTVGIGRERFVVWT